jgi:hypothetical protein
MDIYQKHRRRPPFKDEWIVRSVLTLIRLMSLHALCAQIFLDIASHVDFRKVPPDRPAVCIYYADEVSMNGPTSFGNS